MSPNGDGFALVLFDSLVFVALFLPLVLAAFHVLNARSLGRAAWFLLVLASLFYYGWWNWRYVGLIVLSAAFNFTCARAIENGVVKRLALWIGVCGNLALLAYFKYANFFVVTANQLLPAESEIHWPAVALPIAISFFTFQQIAYLVDSSRGMTRSHGVLDYLLFVSFFPQLIAGPIVHHSEMLPQFRERQGRRLEPALLAAGLMTFALGLAKKVLIADRIAAYSTPVFDAVAKGAVPTIVDAWIAALCYTMQLYFDFSGYSDMAIGIGLMFGIRLPLNFNAPYKASSIIDFWQRWHMTLSRFLREYLYFSLGGNRRGTPRRYVNLMLTMLLGGLWHGAGWNFIVWGALHGVYLCANHAWRAFERRHLQRHLALSTSRRAVLRGAGSALTFLAVVVGWVVFRAANLEVASTLLQTMFGFGAISLESMVGRREAIGTLLAACLIVWAMPTTQRFVSQRDHKPGGDAIAPSLAVMPARWLRWQPTAPWAVGFLLLLLASWWEMTDGVPGEFIYYQF